VTAAENAALIGAALDAVAGFLARDLLTDSFATLWLPAAPAKATTVEGDELSLAGDLAGADPFSTGWSPLLRMNAASAVH
jgi:hypothetical protein